MIHRAFVRCSMVLAFLGALFLAGCGKSDAPSTPAAKPASPSTIHYPPSTNPAPILRLHWLGKKKIATESNATNFMAIWNLPESVKLEAQTLAKLATAPWRLWATNVSLSNAPSAQLRPLLADLVQEEFYLEAQSGPDQTAEWLLAVKLPAERAAVWQTNLPVVLQSLFGTVAESNSALRTPHSALPTSDFQLSTFNLQLSLRRAGDWTLFSLSSATLNSQPSTLLTTFRDRIAATKTPFPPRATNYWVEAQADLTLLRWWGLGGNLQTNLPRLDLRLLGENGNIRTTGELTFPGLAPIEIEPWNIPTNLVHDPLISFTATRGFRPLLEALGFWDVSRLGPTPNQATFWVQAGTPALRFFAFPSLQASNQITLLDGFLLKEVNPQFATFPNTTNVPLGLFETKPDGHRLRWRGIPYLMPNLDVAGEVSNPFIAGGLFPNRITNQPAPDSLVSQFGENSNLIAYDWEQTQASEYALIQVSQAIRFIFGRNRLSLTNNPSLPWLVAISPKLGPASTSILLASSHTLALTRTSTIGLTSLEIHLLAEWLESPSFPQGLFFLRSASAPKPNHDAPAPQP